MTDKRQAQQRLKAASKPKPPKMTPAEQSERFKEAASELGCDESEERFAGIVTKIANAGPQHKPSKARRAKSE